MDYMPVTSVAGFSLSPFKRQCCRLAGSYNRMAEEQNEVVNGPTSENAENKESAPQAEAVRDEGMSQQQLKQAMGKHLKSKK